MVPTGSPEPAYRRDVRRFLLVPLLLLPVACSEDDDASDQVVAPAEGPSTTEDDEGSTTTTTTTATTATTATTQPAPFDGATTPTSIGTTAAAVALLTDVTVTGTAVTFTFRDDVPGIDARYVDEVVADGSGEAMAVGGAAHVEVRMEPASGVDLSSESGSYEETYTGPERIDGPGPVVEVARTGDFEANLTWAIGLTDERPYRIDVEGTTVTVTFAP